MFFLLFSHHPTRQNKLFEKHQPWKSQILRYLQITLLFPQQKCVQCSKSNYLEMLHGRCYIPQLLLAQIEHVESTLPLFYKQLAVPPTPILKTPAHTNHLAKETTHFQSISHFTNPKGRLTLFETYGIQSK